MPFEFLRLPVVAVLAFAIFGEVPDRWVWAGAAVIFASTLYIAHREAVVARAEADRHHRAQSLRDGPPTNRDLEA
jgi:drug/metabolite transporter (DMT)-like permease